MSFHKQLLVLFYLIGTLDGFNLKCHDDLHPWGLMTNVKTCISWKELGHNTYITSRYDSLTSVNGRPIGANFRSNNQVITFKSQVVNYIPEGLGTHFSRILGFRVHNSKLKEVIKGDIDQFPHLRELYLDFNELKSLPADLLDGNPDLELFIMNNNHISRIGHDLLTFLRKLHKVNLDSNRCTNAAATERHQIPYLIAEIEEKCVEKTTTTTTTTKSTTTTSTPTTTTATPASTPTTVTTAPNPDSTTSCNNRIAKLEAKLDLQDRIIDAATRQLFHESASTAINLNSSPVIDVKCKVESSICDVIDFVVADPESTIGEIVKPDGTVIDQNTHKIKQLRVVEQQVLYLPTNIAEKLPDLTEIWIDQSALFSLHAESFEDLTSLISIEIVNSKIRAITQKSFKDNAKVTILNFSGNQIELVNDDAFEGLEKLSDLNLARNLLTFINLKVFADLKSLKSLHLEHNSLKSLSFGIFSNLPQLSMVNLSTNEIEELKDDIFQTANEIKTFIATDNKLTSINSNLVTKLETAELIDFSSNKCVDDKYVKSSTKTFDSFKTMIQSKC